MHTIFRALVWAHLSAGSVGLVLFWVETLGTAKGGRAHKVWGKVFVACMLFTGTMALLMSTLTLLDPFTTHPHFVGHPTFGDGQLVRALFGWMMQFLALLTVSLAWHGWGVVVHKRDHGANRNIPNMVLQVAVIVTALNTAWRGWVIGQPVMLGLPVVGVASGVTNLWFACGDTPRRFAYLIEHVKALVGAGISAYTAFLAFGLVRLMPDRVFTPVLWAIPLGGGLAIIIYHTVRFMRLRGRGVPVSAVVPGSGSRASGAW